MHLLVPLFGSSSPHCYRARRERYVDLQKFELFVGPKMLASEARLGRQILAQEFARGAQVEL